MRARLLVLNPHTKQRGEALRIVAGVGRRRLPRLICRPLLHGRFCPNGITSVTTTIVTIAWKGLVDNPIQNVQFPLYASDDFTFAAWGIRSAGDSIMRDNTGKHGV